MTRGVLIVELPSLLRQIVLDTLEAEGRAKMVGCGQDDAEEDINLAEAILRYVPDVIVTTFTGRELAPAASALCRRNPAVVCER